MEFAPVEILGRMKSNSYLPDEISYMGTNCTHGLSEQSTWNLPFDVV